MADRWRDALPLIDAGNLGDETASTGSAELGCADRFDEVPASFNPRRERRVQTGTTVTPMISRALTGPVSGKAARFVLDGV